WILKEVDDEVVAHARVKFVADNLADNDLIRISRAGKVDKRNFHHVLFEQLLIETVPHTFQQYAEHFFLCLDSSRLDGELLLMTDIRELSRIIKQRDIVIHRRSFRRIIGGEAGHQQVTAKPVYFVLNRFLEAFQNEKGHDKRGKADTDTDHGDLVNSRRKTAALFTTYSARNEIGEVQLIYYNFPSDHAK